VRNLICSDNYGIELKQRLGIQRFDHTSFLNLLDLSTLSVEVDVKPTIGWQALTLDELLRPELLIIIAQDVGYWRSL
jgi:hypothetical protein